MSAEERLARAFLERRPTRAALALEQMSRTHAAAVLRVVPTAVSVGVVREMTPPHAAGLLGHLPPESAAELIAALPAVYAAAVLRALDEGPRTHLLDALPVDAREPLARLLQYPVGTAGGAMDPSVFQLPEDVLVADARTRLRGAARDLLYYLYVVDRDQRLVGVMDIPELMLARARDPVSVAMHRDVDSLSAWTPEAQVREHPAWHLYHAMPVVDEERRLLGAIRYQTLRRLEREAGAEGANPALLTAQALGELFQIGTNGMVAGVAATAAVVRGRRNEGEQRALDEVSDAP